MNSFKISNKSVGGENDDIFIIAEIGQNHQGSLEIAKRMIFQAKVIDCDCVKFQKSCLSSKFTAAALNRPYDDPNSWGKTYGEHKSFLEFSIDQYKELRDYANKIGIIFSASAMDEISFQDLLRLNLPFIKIGSGDANNFPLIELAAKSDTPLIISTGMQTMKTIQKIVEIMKIHKKSNFCLMHCISAYPTKPEDTRLGLIKLLKEKFPGVVVGYSGHEKQTLISKVALLQGAKVIERHFTFDKTQKGSDHKSSLTPLEFEDLIQFSREFKKTNFKNEPFNAEDCISFLSACSDKAILIRAALKEYKSRDIYECEKLCRNKLGKSIVYARKLSKGHSICTNDLAVKVSEPFGVSAENLEQFLGEKLKENVCSDDVLLESHFF